MNFDQIQKMWDEKNQAMLYVINEDAVKQSILRKKHSALRLNNINEWGLILIYSAVSVFLLYAAITSGNWWNYPLLLVQLFAIGYVVRIRMKRRKAEGQFHRTMVGELEHAIFNTKATIRLGSTMTWWYLLPATVFIFMKMIADGASVEKWLVVIVLMILANLVVSWEIRRIHFPRLRKYEALLAKLAE